MALDGSGGARLPPWATVISCGMGVYAAVRAKPEGGCAQDVRKTPRKSSYALAWTGDDEETIVVIKVGAALGIAFLAIFTVFDIGRVGFTAPSAGYHALALSGACLFLGIAWTRAFRRIWKFWTLVFCAFLMTMFVVISSLTGDPESRFIAIILCPLATASFINWGPRWQLALNSICIVVFATAEKVVPISGHFQFYRWMGLVAALSFAQCTAIFLERYRQRIRAQLDALDEAARFRDAQIATMAHDIRSPVAALAGYAQLLEEDSHAPAGQRDLLHRLGSTAWRMNVVVSNALDLYRFEEYGGFHPERVARDLNAIIAEAAEDCRLQARRKGFEIQCSIERLPPLAIDRHHLDSIVRNLAIGVWDCTEANPIRLSVRCREMCAVLVAETPHGALPQSAPTAGGSGLNRARRPEGARAIGWFLVGAMAEAAGGRVTTHAGDAGGFSVAVEIPFPAGVQQL